MEALSSASFKAGEWIQTLLSNFLRHRLPAPWSNESRHPVLKLPVASSLMMEGWAVGAGVGRRKMSLIFLVRIPKNQPVFACLLEVLFSKLTSIGWPYDQSLWTSYATTSNSNHHSLRIYMHRFACSMIVLSDSWSFTLPYAVSYRWSTPPFPLESGHPFRTLPLPSHALILHVCEASIHL